LLMSLLDTKYDFEITKYILKYYLQKHFAITDIKIHTRIDIVKISLELGAKIRIKKLQDLICTSYHYDLEIVKFLIRQGVKLNIKAIL